MVTETVHEGRIAHAPPDQRCRGRKNSRAWPNNELQPTLDCEATLLPQSAPAVKAG